MSTTTILPPPAGCQRRRPLLLSEGTPDLCSQVNHVECRGYEMPICSRLPDNTLYVCHVDPRGIRESIPLHLRHGGRLGCISINTTSLQAVMRGDCWVDQSFLLFRTRAEFRAAWSIARRLAKATRGNLAAFGPGEFGEITWAILCERHNTDTSIADL